MNNSGFAPGMAVGAVIVALVVLLALSSGYITLSPKTSPTPTVNSVSPAYPFQDLPPARVYLLHQSENANNGPVATVWEFQGPDMTCFWINSPSTGNDIQCQSK